MKESVCLSLPIHTPNHRHPDQTQVKASEMAAKRSGRGAIPIQTMPNERALLSLFFQKLQQEDPDVLVAHNLMGFDFDILLSRAVQLKLPTWSKVRCCFFSEGGGALICCWP